MVSAECTIKAISIEILKVVSGVLLVMIKCIDCIDDGAIKV